MSDNIIVLYRGSVAETGDVEQVIKDPQHPYTQLLVSSIPLPDPERRWGEDVVAAGKSEVGTGEQIGCKFADRCPYVMPMCRESPPPLYRTSAHRAVACYLYEGFVLRTEVLLQEDEDLPIAFAQSGLNLRKQNVQIRG